MILKDKLFDYLASKITDFQKTTKSGSFLFSCPNNGNHKFKSKNPTATIINGSDKISCLICGFKGTIFDCVRTLEADKKHKSDAEITQYLIGSLDVDMYGELDYYKKYNWSIVPIAKNSKNPFEKDWVNQEHKEKLDWIKWLNNGLNLGLNCGKSNVIVIDVDDKEVIGEELVAKREEIIKLLEDSKTLKQNSPHGKHYIFKVDSEITQTVNIGGLKIDTRCAGGQILVSPSKIDNLNYNWVNLGAEIKEISAEIKSKLLSFNKVETIRNEVKTELPQLKNNNLQGCCNDTFVRLGGTLLKNGMSPKDVEIALSVFNTQILEQPMPASALKGMLNSLENYKETEEDSQEQSIYEYLRLMQTDISAKDIMDSLKITRASVDKYLSKFVKEGKAIRLSRGRYQYKEKIEWLDSSPTEIEEYKYRVPFFNDVAVFQDGDVILLGARTNEGKTTFALNMLKEIIAQGLKPFYIYSEAGSRFQKTAQLLDISGKFFHCYHENPLAISLEKNSFTIIDWLHLEHKEFTDTILKHLNDEVQRKKGILSIFTQLKQTHEWFAPNLIDHFPTFAARYVQDNEQKTEGHWDIGKIKEPKGNYCTYSLPCSFDRETKIFKNKSLI